jgi:hypothetical protein
MAEKTFDQELADIENQLGNSAIPETVKAPLRKRKEEILKNPQYRYAKAHGLPTAKSPNAGEIQQANTDYESLANKNIGVLDNTPQAPKDNLKDIDNTKASGATKEELDYMLENGQISRSAYEKQIAALHTPEVQEKMKEGTELADEYKSDSTDSSLGSKVAAEAGIDSTPDKDDTPKEEAAKKRYNRSMMSIWDAVREGEIDKDTAAYFTIDAIATLAKNLGRGIGNVGAQFTGGTIDQGHDTSKWEERRNRLFGEESEMEAEGMGGPSGRKAEMENLDVAAKRIRNEYTPAQLETQLGLLQKELEMAGINVNLASSKTDIINHIKSDPNYSNDPIKMGIVAYLSQAGMAGAANAGGNTLANAANWILTLAK